MRWSNSVVFHDIMGLSKNKAPKHAKQQLNLYEEILHAEKYKEAVKNLNDYNQTG